MRPWALPSSASRSDSASRRMRSPVFRPLRGYGPDGSICAGGESRLRCVDCAVAGRFWCFVARTRTSIAAAIRVFARWPPDVGGLCEMSRRYSLGEPANFDDSLDGFKQNTPRCLNLASSWPSAPPCGRCLGLLILGTVFHIGAPDRSETLYVDSSTRRIARKCWPYRHRRSTGDLRVRVSVVSIP